MMYTLVAISVVMFGLTFLCNQQYQREHGSGAMQVISLTFYQGISGLIVLLIINNFKFECTPFSFIMAFLATLNTILFTICSLKALADVNLSLFSLCSMLGGAVLPSLLGIIFYNEGITLGKILCFVFTFLSLFITSGRGYSGGHSKTKTGIYCTGVFILNGMSGVISKIFTSSQYSKTSDAGFSILTALMTVVIAMIPYFVLIKKMPKYTPKSWFCSLGYGALHKLAKLFLLISLTAGMPASVQFPLVTIGVIIVSALICLITSQKLGKRDIISILLAFCGIVALTALPI